MKVHIVYKVPEMDSERGRIQRGKTLQKERRFGFSSSSVRSAQSAHDLRRSLTAKKKQNFTSTLTSRAMRTTKVVDARQKLGGKPKVDVVPKTGVLSQQRQRDQRQRKRSLDLSDGSLKVTTRQEIRSATLSGGSIQITAKVGGRGSDERSDFSPLEKYRKTNSMTGNLTITTKNNTVQKKREPIRIPEKFYSPPFDSVDEISDTFLDTEKDFALGDFEGRLGRSYRPVADSQASHTSTAIRVTVKNLHPSVSQQDIEELFGVLGQLKSCKLVHPGVAEVVYANKQDALTAHARYHNRNLDGQPMLCKLSSLPSVMPYMPATGRPLPPLQPTTPVTAHPPVLSRTPPNKQPPIQAPRPVVFKVRI